MAVVEAAMEAAMEVAMEVAEAVGEEEVVAALAGPTISRWARCASGRCIPSPWWSESPKRKPPLTLDRPLHPLRARC